MFAMKPLASLVFSISVGAADLPEQEERVACINMGNNNTVIAGDVNCSGNFGSSAGAPSDLGTLDTDTYFGFGDYDVFIDENGNEVYYYNGLDTPPILTEDDTFMNDGRFDTGLGVPVFNNW